MTWTPAGDLVPEAHFSPTLVVDSFLLGRSELGIGAWKAGSAELSWFYDLPDQRPMGKRVVVSDGTRAFTFTDTRRGPWAVDAYDIEAGTHAWHAQVDVKPGANCLAVWKGDLVMRGLAGKTYTLLRLSAKDGSEVERGKTVAGARILAAGDGLFAPSGSGLRFGTSLGGVDTIAEIAVGPAVVDADHLIAVTGDREKVTELVVRRWNAAGEPVGEVTLDGTSLDVRLLPLGGGRAAVFPEGRVDVVDLAKGAVVWSADTLPEARARDAALVDGRLVTYAYNSTDRAVLRTWDAATGEHLGDDRANAPSALTAVGNELVLSLHDGLQRHVWS